jgi:hypothetical protein
MNWLDLFCDALAAGPAFRQRLDEGLRPGFVAATHQEPCGWTLVPPPEGIAVAADGTAEAVTDLVGPDAQGWPVTVCWRLDGGSCQLPSDPQVEAAAAQGTLRVWWQSGPELQPATAAALPDVGPLPFAIEFRPYPWPDVWLEIQLAPGADAIRVLTGLVTRLQAVQQRWNASGPGLIHQVGSQAAVLGPDVAVVNIDFGSAGPPALAAVLQALAADAPTVRTVIVRSASREAR